MLVIRRGLWLLVLIAGSAAPAMADDGAAQKAGAPDPAAPEAVISGQVASSTLLYQESGAAGVELAPDGAQPETASRYRRLFTDLRFAVDALHLGGGGWDVRIDGRARRVLTSDPGSATTTEEVPVQSGSFGDAEYELRELSVARRGHRVDVEVGRQTVLEVAATKIDGVRVGYQGVGAWRFAGFGGAYPQRGSRSLTDDYPLQVSSDGEVSPSERVVPVAAGVGGAYRYDRLYGSVGVASIWPRTRAPDTGLPDVPRVLVTSSGYWHGLESLDLYHYAVVDLEGSLGTGITNLSLGMSYHPVRRLQVSARLTRIDSEVLAATARNQLEERDDLGGDRVQNAVDLTRISSESARLGASVSLGRDRFRLATSGTLRRRPETSVVTSAGGSYQFPSSQTAELSLSAIDRRSLLGFRLGATLSRILSVGDDTGAPRRDARLARLSAQRELGGARASTLEFDASYLSTRDDDGASESCSALDPLQCYGTAAARTLQVGALLAHGFDRSWSLVASIYLGQQVLTTSDLEGGRVVQPGVWMATGYLRVAYRF